MSPEAIKSLIIGGVIMAMGAYFLFASG